MFVVRPFVCLSVRMYQRGFHWSNFREHFYWVGTFKKVCWESPVCFKPDKNIGTWRPCCWQQWEVFCANRAYHCISMATKNNSVLLTATCRLLRLIGNNKTRQNITLYSIISYDVSWHIYVQGGSNMTGTICVQTSHSLSRSYLNHLVYICVCVSTYTSGFLKIIFWQRMSGNWIALPAIRFLWPLNVFMCGGGGFLQVSKLL
jgi:hypothetical protein